jgi:hypothetical protein
MALPFAGRRSFLSLGLVATAHGQGAAELEREIHWQCLGSTRDCQRPGPAAGVSYSSLCSGTTRGESPHGDRAEIASEKPSGPLLGLIVMSH